MPLEETLGLKGPYFSLLLLGVKWVFFHRTVFFNSFLIHKWSLEPIFFVVFQHLSTFHLITILTSGRFRYRPVNIIQKTIILYLCQWFCSISEVVNKVCTKIEPGLLWRIQKQRNAGIFTANEWTFRDYGMFFDSWKEEVLSSSILHSTQALLR